MKDFKKLLMDQEGAALLLVALSLVVLIGFAALVADIGILTKSKRQLVTTADAAALAGVQELAKVPVKTDPNYFNELSDAKRLAADKALVYAKLNYPGIFPDLDAEEAFKVFVIANIKYEDTEKSVTVPLVKHDIGFTFAKIWGKTHGSVSASAKAAIEYVDTLKTDGSSGNLFPLFLTESAFKSIEDLEEFKIKGKDAASVVYEVNGKEITLNGNSGFASFPQYGSDASKGLPAKAKSSDFQHQNKIMWYLLAGGEYSNGVNPGDLGLSVGAYIRTDTGTVASATDYMQYRFDNRSRYALVPIVTDTFSKNGGMVYNNIIGYSMIKITNISGNDFYACLDPKELVSDFNGTTTPTEPVWNRSAPKVAVLIN